MVRLFGTTARLVSSGTLMVLGWRILHKVSTGVYGDGPEGIPFAIMGMGLWLVACIILAPKLLPAATSIFSGFIDAIYMPSSTAKPPLDYRLADHLLANGQVSHAVSEYLKLAHYYPTELKPYNESIRICIDCRDFDAAREIYQKARQNLKNTEAWAILQQTFGAKLGL